MRVSIATMRQSAAVSVHGVDTPCVAATPRGLHALLVAMAGAMCLGVIMLPMRQVSSG